MSNTWNVVPSTVQVAVGFPVAKTEFGAIHDLEPFGPVTTLVPGERSHVHVVPLRWRRGGTA
jgi:hypothetical protein